MPHDAFEKRADRYEALIDWPKRLTNEGPFYRRLFDEVGVKRVLDVACGTGHHVEMFHSWGLTAEGADVSEAMIEHARARLSDSDRVRWAVRSFDEPCSTPGAFDAVICVGNSLALAEESTTIPHVIEMMLAALRPGGLCIVQVLNLWRLVEGETIWQKCKRVAVEDEDHVLLKAIHRVGSRAFIDFCDLILAEGDVDGAFDAATFSGIEADVLATAARDAGASGVELFGNYQFADYDRATSPDLILVARR